MKNYKAGIYLRLSKEDDNRNNSIDAQREITSNYARKYGFSIIKEYVDNGWSGILDSRPALNEMILDILHKRINMLIVKDLSRLTRDKNKTGYYTEIFFPDNDVRFISVNDYIDSGERYEIDDTIMLRGIVNQSYLADVSKKIKSVINNMKEQGMYVQYSAPYGYKKSDTEKHKLIIDEQVAGNVKKIFDMYAEGYSQGQIAKYLTSQGIDTPKKYKGFKVTINEWRNDSVGRILKDPVYRGALVINKFDSDYLTKKAKKTKSDDWKTIENTHEAIVDKELFDKVQSIRKNKYYEPKQTYQYLLRDLVRCGHCGNKMQYKNITRTKVHNKKLDNPQKWWYYKCRTVYRFPSICDKGHIISEKALNEIVIHSLNKKLQTIKSEIGLDKIKDEYKKSDSKYILLLKSKSQKQKIENDIRILYNKKIDEMITVEEFKEKYSILKEQENQINNELKQLEDECKHLISADQLLKIIKDFKTAENFDNNIMKMLINKIEVFEDRTVNIIFNF